LVLTEKPGAEAKDVGDNVFRALQIDSRDPRAWWGKGDVFLDQGQSSSAFECYSKGDAVDSKNAYGGLLGQSGATTSSIAETRPMHFFATKELRK
jgi:hypothetical protein